VLNKAQANVNSENVTPEEKQSGYRQETGWIKTSKIAGEMLSED
jgi:hypothetical protein